MKRSLLANLVIFSFAMGCLPQAGCLHHVHELVDESICERAKDPIDIQKESSSEILEKEKKLISEKATQDALKAPKDRPVDGLMDSMFEKQQKEGLRERLDIPAGLPGAKDPPVTLPPLDDANPGKRKAALEKLYAPLPELAADYEPPLGPDGKPYTLADLQKIAMTNSPKIKQAYAAVAAARGAAVQAGLHPNPEIGYEGDTMRTNNSAGYQGGYIQQTIVTAAKLPMARQVALMELRITELTLRKTETEVAREVRNGFFAVQVARQNILVSQALAKLAAEVYGVIIDQVKKGGFAAPYEPFQIRVLALQAYAQVVQAKNRYVSAWKQLAAGMGVPGLPVAQLAGDINIPIPIYNYEECIKRVTLLHTNVGSAEFLLLKAQSQLRLAQITPIPDVNLRVMLQKDYTVPPASPVSPSVQVGIPVPIWNRNQGNIAQAEGELVSATEAKHRARNELTASLAEAFERYENNRVLLGYYRDQILPDQIRTYRGIFDRFHVEPGVAEGDALTFADVVNAQNILSGSVAQYLQILGNMWVSVVDIAFLLQTDDLYQFMGERVPTEWLSSSQAIEELINLPGRHPCSTLPDIKFKGVDGKWPAATLEPKRVMPNGGQMLLPAPRQPTTEPPASK